MAQRFRFLFQLFLFIRLKMCFFQLFYLKTDVVFILSVLFCQFLKISQFMGHFLIVGIQFLVSLQFHLVMCQYVKNAQLEIFMIQQQILMLAMYINQLFA